MYLGVLKSIHKQNEKRVPIYPEHIPLIDKKIRIKMFFEQGYGKDFDYDDDYFAKKNAGVLSRDEIFKKCDILLLAKPDVSDLICMKRNQILWGWVHCVQQTAITQVAIERKLTLIAWEAMNLWNNAGEKVMHILYKNNEVAGYAAVLHVLQLMGLDGHYGPRRRVAVISYGAVSRGAIYALQGRGFNNIHVYTKRPVHLVGDQNPDVYYSQFFEAENGDLMTKQPTGETVPFIEELNRADIICNGILQDTDKPIVFIKEEDITKMKRRCIIIDISCDEGMGFYFAKPTSFESPTFRVGENITYYSVDHTATYLWNAASREISRALLPYLSQVLAGSKHDTTIKRAIEIRNGVIVNPKILRFQNRSPRYPHAYKSE